MKLYINSVIDMEKHFSGWEKKDNKYIIEGPFPGEICIINQDTREVEEYSGYTGMISDMINNEEIIVLEE